mgnify:FL=1
MYRAEIILFVGMLLLGIMAPLTLQTYAWYSGALVVGFALWLMLRGVGRAPGRAVRLAALVTQVWLTGGLWSQAGPRATTVFTLAALAVVAPLVRPARRGTPWLVTAGILAMAATLVLVPLHREAKLSDTGTGPTVAQQPQVFAPIALDDSGRHLLLWSLLDSDQADDRQSLWSLDAANGGLHRVYQGYPLPLTEWAPGGDRLTFAASTSPWDSGAVPFGIYVAERTGATTERLAPPSDGSSWMYPSWSRQGNRLGVWRLPSAPELGSVSAPQVPRSYVLDADGGQPTELTVRGARMSLLSAWEAQGPGALVMTEHGIYLSRPDEKARRLVPAGEAPLDPYPVAIQDGVARDGQHVAYLELTFRGGRIDKINVRVVDLQGRRRGGIDRVVPLAMAWSGDGRVLAALTEGRGGGLVLRLLDPATKKVRSLPTGLKQVERDFPCRLEVNQDGSLVAINGSLSESAMLSIALVDTKSGETVLRDDCHNHLQAGWLATGWLVVSDMESVAAIGPGGARRDIYKPSQADGLIGYESRLGLIATAARAPERTLKRLAGYALAGR